MKELIHKVVIAFLATLLPLSFMIGMNMGIIEVLEEEEPQALATEMTNVYKCEYRDDEIMITTDSDYFIRLSDHTVIITDKVLTEVEKEIRFVKILEE